mgnify:FL=1|tara:strand:+ start:209 stop:391 length:183 start_codon:yes stop_codon:yes gene_type:complete
MEWLSQNWVWVLFGVGFVAMHMFGHGSHGSHGHGGHQTGNKPAVKEGEKRPLKKGKGHQH